MSRSNHAAEQISTYQFPDELSMDELLVRGSVEADALANGIWRVEADVRIGNSASERVLERLGFEREGVKRRYLRHGEDRVDATMFALLAGDA